MNKNNFICDGCGGEYSIEESVNINTPNLAGIVMCKNCAIERKIEELANNQKPLDQEFADILDKHFWNLVGNTPQKDRNNE